MITTTTQAPCGWGALTAAGQAATQFLTVPWLAGMKVQTALLTTLLLPVPSPGLDQLRPVLTALAERL